MVVPDSTIQFKSGRSRSWPDLGTEVRSEPEPNLGRTCFFGFGSYSNAPDKSNGVIRPNTISCYNRQYSWVLPLLLLPVLTKFVEWQRKHWNDRYNSIYIRYCL